MRPPRQSDGFRLPRREAGTSKVGQTARATATIIRCASSRTRGIRIGQSSKVGTGTPRYWITVTLSSIVPTRGVSAPTINDALQTPASCFAEGAPAELTVTGGRWFLSGCYRNGSQRRTLGVQGRRLTIGSSQFQGISHTSPTVQAISPTRTGILYVHVRAAYLNLDTPSKWPTAGSVMIWRWTARFRPASDRPRDVLHVSKV